MIELKRDALAFSFPEVHSKAHMSVDFQRTLRIPDDDSTYPLPPGLGRFPVRHVDDFAAEVPRDWIEHGGVALPMYQSEAMWLNFHSPAGYPFALKVAAGKICAVTGETWRNELGRRPQDYLVVPTQPWLDGYCVEKGLIRQFVAMPLGAGYTAEEQITGEAEHGGIQLIAYPMRREVYHRRFETVRRQRAAVDSCLMEFAMPAPVCAAMGLAPGGRMRQEIYDDPYGFSDWDAEHSSRCFVHIANSMTWHQITGEWPPTAPPTARDYTQAGLPWFDYYADGHEALEGSSVLAKLKSVFQLGQEKGDVPLPENQPVNPAHIVHLRRGLAKHQVREW